jgi:glucose dehydrogenase
MVPQLAADASRGFADALPSAAMRSALALAALVSLLVVAVAHPRAQRGPAAGDWPNHGGDVGSSKYSPLDQITAANVASLRIAWRRP